MEKRNQQKKKKTTKNKRISIEKKFWNKEKYLKIGKNKKNKKDCG